MLFRIMEGGRECIYLWVKNIALTYRLKSKQNRIMLLNHIHTDGMSLKILNKILLKTCLYHKTKHQ